MRATCRAIYAESVPERLTVYVPICGWYGMVWCGMGCCLVSMPWRPGVSFCSFLRGRGVDADAAVIRTGMRSSYQ